MADIRPFRAVTYAGPLEAVIAPPYDVLDGSQVAALRERSPHNVVRLTRPGEDRASAAAAFAQWLEAGILVEDPEPAMYVHETEFGGRTRRDLLAVLRLEPYDQGAVLPHERTHRGPREDRLALLQAVGVSLEPLWFLQEGVAAVLETVPAGPEARRFEHAGELHTLRRIADPAWLDRASRTLAAQPALIADGHHRYETALVHAEKVGGGPDAASRFTLALLTDLGDPGLVVLPTHRLLRTGIAVTGGERVDSLPALLARLEGEVAFGTYREGRFQFLPLEGEVPVVELHRQVIDNLMGRRAPEDVLEYTRDPEEAVRWVDEGRGVAAFFLGAPDLGAVLKLARQGMTMPQKATYFFPKPPSGMAFHRLDSRPPS